MTYTKDEFFEYANKISSHISTVGDYPDGFKLLHFIEFADNFLQNNGVLPFLKDGIFKELIQTVNHCKYAYDFDDYEEHKQYNFEKFEVFKVLDICLNWILVNDSCDYEFDELAADEYACQKFNNFKHAVLSLPIEHASLIASITEAQHR